VEIQAWRRGDDDPSDHRAGAYTAHFQRALSRITPARVAIVALLLSMLLTAELAGLGSGPIYLIAVAPTLLVGVILTIAYDQRYAVGVAAMHGLLVTRPRSAHRILSDHLGGRSLRLFPAHDIRSRSKLVEVGGVAALAMMPPPPHGAPLLWTLGIHCHNCLYAGAAGLAVGFLVLGILPFIEKAFRITTNMTLLETG